MLHGAFKIKNKKLTRKSLVFHYHFSGCIKYYNPIYSLTSKNIYAERDLKKLKFKMFEEKEIIKILSKALNTKLSNKSNDKNVKKWDSFGQLQILATLDKHTKGKSSKIKGLDTASSVSQIIKLLKKNL